MRTVGCFLLGVSTDITGAKAQDEARQFSQAVFDLTDLDGILYLSRLTRRTCVAVYDRAVAAKLDAGPVHELETLAALVPALAALRIVLIWLGIPRLAPSLAGAHHVVRIMVTL
jgi:hypothetical protein